MNQLLPNTPNPAIQDLTTTVTPKAALKTNALISPLCKRPDRLAIN
jgi:hypothetical protein